MKARKNIYNENEVCIEEIYEKYFKPEEDLVPIIFNKLVDEYNVKLYGVDLSAIQQIKKIKKQCPIGETIAGLAKLDSEVLTIYYNNNRSISIEEQRFIICYLFLKSIVYKDKKILETLQSIHKSDYTFNNMTKEEFNNYMINKNVRNIMMPSNYVNVFYNLNLPNLTKKKLLSIISEVFLISEDQVKLRLQEMGLEKTKKSNGLCKKYNLKSIKRKKSTIL